MNLRWKVAQAAEIRWWKLYLRRKDPQEYLRRKAAYWRRVLKQAALELLPGQRIRIETPGGGGCGEPGAA